MKHGYKVGVALSESANKITCNVISANEKLDYIGNGAW